ncbi:hypothetical protein T492DRAFT_974226 [Pavlovales sp. CCMP2436]|nr:hypothetical protein T492DRAFT_974226 [Pavlovales sp. CCMP2436]
MQADAALAAATALVRAAQTLAPRSSAGALVRLATGLLTVVWAGALGAFCVRWLAALQPYRAGPDGREVGGDALSALWSTLALASLPLAVGWPATLACATAAQRAAWRCGDASVDALRFAESWRLGAALAADSAEP